MKTFCYQTVRLGYYSRLDVKREGSKFFWNLGFTVGLIVWTTLPKTDLTPVVFNYCLLDRLH